MDRGKRERKGGKGLEHKKGTEKCTESNKIGSKK